MATEQPQGKEELSTGQRPGWYCYIRPKICSCVPSGIRAVVVLLGFALTLRFGTIFLWRHLAGSQKLGVIFWVIFFVHLEIVECLRQRVR